MEEIFANWLTVIPPRQLLSFTEERRDDCSPVEHGVESCDFVNPHGWNFDQVGNIVHDAYASPALILPLPQVEKWDDGSFLVLRRVPSNDLLGLGHVVWCELEWDLAKFQFHVSRKFQM